ncbi:MAG TPA: hypothetical protein VH643_35635 [Gemmataceae bacterium]|jgi:hypothetical protein
MKIVFFGESPADQAALAVFTEGILGRPPETIDMGLEGHGVTGVLNALGGVFRGVYYNSDAEGLVVVVDCDDTELHHSDHDKPGKGGERCRLCQARTIIEQSRKHLKARSGRPALQVTIGLAVPAIEAWYLVGQNRQVGEAAWRTALTVRQFPFTRRKLKELVYGTDRLSRTSDGMRRERSPPDHRRHQGHRDCIPGWFWLDGERDPFVDRVVARSH